LEIYQAADHRNPADISATWVHYLDYTHQTVVDKIANGDPDAPQPYEAIITGVRDLAYRLNLNETTFPPDVLIPLLEKYKVEQQRDIGPSTWVMDLFLEVEIPHETIIPILERILYNNEAPFSGRNCSYIANDAFYVIEKWYAHCIRRNTPLFGGVDNARGMVQFLTMLTGNGLAQEKRHDALELRQRIEAQLRR
jgi:nuclear pore complex protein Nup155